MLFFLNLICPPQTAMPFTLSAKFFLPIELKFQLMFALCEPLVACKQANPVYSHHIESVIMKKSLNSEMSIRKYNWWHSIELAAFLWDPLWQRWCSCTIVEVILKREQEKRVEECFWRGLGKLYSKKSLSLSNTLDCSLKIFFFAIVRSQFEISNLIWSKIYHNRKSE